MSNLSTKNRTSWPERIHDAQVETAEAFNTWHAARDAGAAAMERIRLRKRADDAAARRRILRRMRAVRTALHSSIMSSFLTRLTNGGWRL
jgi:hypothetical protein